MKLVEFNDGSFGIRAHWFFGWHFVDLVIPSFKWTFKDMFFHDCKGSREKCEEIMAQMRCHKYRVVKTP